ncbi:hypothetical protein JT143_05515 [Helicobacter pylori]|nr:hypothetical protein [Helicobacter pylori]
MTIIRELGYQYEQNSVVYSTSNSSEAWLYFTTPLKSAFFEKSVILKSMAFIKAVKILVFLSTH